MIAGKRGGARKKAPGGLKYALFIRVDKALLVRIDKIVGERRRPGIVLSRADVARSLLWAALDGPS